jgi:hypothetical protein
MGKNSTGLITHFDHMIGFEDVRPYPRAVFQRHEQAAQNVEVGTESMIFVAEKVYPHPQGRPTFRGLRFEPLRSAKPTEWNDGVLQPVNDSFYTSGRRSRDRPACRKTFQESTIIRTSSSAAISALRGGVVNFSKLREI